MPRLSINPVPDWPRVVALPFILLCIMALALGAIAIAGFIGASNESDVAVVIYFILIPALLLSLSGWGIARRSRFGYTLALIILLLVSGGSLLVLLVASEGPSGLVVFLAEPFVILWLAVAMLNGAAAFALTRQSARNWFGLKDWWWRRLRVG